MSPPFISKTSCFFGCIRQGAGEINPGDMVLISKGVLSGGLINRIYLRGPLSFECPHHSCLMTSLRMGVGIEVSLKGRGR